MCSGVTATASLETQFSDHLDVLERRFSRALEVCGFDKLVIFSGSELFVARDDETYPFRVEPYFAQWLPLTRHPGCALVVAPGERPRLLFRRCEDFWRETPEPPTGDWTRYFEIEIVEDLGRSIGSTQFGRGRLAAIGDPGATAELFAAVDDLRLLRRLDYERAVKTDYEVECIARSSAIAVRGHCAVADAFRQGASEFTLNQVYCAATCQRETQLPYVNIIALNEHAAVLHYQNLRSAKPDTLRSFLIDAGARFHGYASDITRTYAHDDGDFAELVARLEMLQQAICSEVASGKDFVNLNDRAHQLLAAVMSEHGILECSADAAYESGLTRTFLPHGLGHLLGLQVHDAGGRQISPDGEVRDPPETDPNLRLTRVLEAGFVLTIEPGIYFIPSLLDALPGTLSKLLNSERIARLLPFGGIRIEDNLRVESAGSENLTRAAFAAA
jgi:Xaa-Pro dipeptidase